MSLPRQRDLLPLRLPDAERVWREGLGRGTRQRISRRLAADAWAREGAQTLNDLYGKAHVVSGVAAPVGTHAFALEHLRGRYQCVGPPPTSRPEEALTALLGSMSIYENDHFECKHASFDESKISWPEPGSSPVEIAELLTPDVGRLLKLDGVCELLADAGEKGLSETVRPYVDPVLANSPTKMGKFLTRLFDANMLSFKPGWEAATVGVFFVYKKNGSHRLILDTRAANQAFAKPRSSRLPTPAAWTSLELDSREVLYTATGDVADAFHRMRLPVHLRKYFRLPSIQCRFLERRLWPSGCSELDYVCPEYATLPMGWCWSLFFCQSLLENAAREAGLRDDDRIEDRSWAGQVSKGRLVHAEYVDNFFVSGTDADLVQRGFNRLRAVLEQWGFRIHDVSDAAPVVEGLGLLIDGNAGRISLTAKRIWKLRLASIALCRRRGAPLPKIVEKIIGHFTFAMLIRRETLSVFSHVYRYCRSDRPNPAIWALAKKELMQASSLLPLMSSSMSGVWDTTVSATDSSDVGYGVCERHLPAPAVARTARTCEAWRYKVAGAIKARENALGLVDSGERLPHYLQDECARVCSSQFEEVQPFILDSTAWHTVFSGRWHYEENILRTEGRACISGVRHKLRSLRSCGRRHLLLVDNLSLALALTKGRGSSYIANRSCQQLCALSLASDCKFFVRWIPSERNCADKPSRSPLIVQNVSSDSASCHGSRGSHPAAPCGESQLPGSAPTQKHRRAASAKGTEETSRPSLDSGHLGGEPIALGAVQGETDCDTGEVSARVGDFSGVVRGVPSVDPQLGRPTYCLPQRALRARGKRQRRGVHVRRLQAQVPRVRQVRRARAAQGHPSLRRLPQPGAAAHAPADPKGGIHRHHRGAVGAKNDHHGHRPPSAVGSVTQARRTCEPDCWPAGPASWHRGYVQMGCHSGSVRRWEWRPKQNQPLRRGHYPLANVGFSDRSHRGTEGSSTDFADAFSRHLRPARRAVQESGGSRGSGTLGCNSLREPPRRSKRHEATWCRASGNQKAGSLGCRLQPAKVRKSHSSAAAASEGPGSDASLRRLRRDSVEATGADAAPSHPPALGRQPGGSSATGGAAAQTELGKRVRRHLRRKFQQALRQASVNRRQVFVELFARNGAIFHGLRKLGVAVVTFDVGHCQLENVLHPVVQSTLLGWITSGAVLGIWVGTPSSSWSFNKASFFARTKKHILGIPSLYGKHLDAVSLGNRTMQFSAEVIRRCIRCGVPCCLENPLTSLLFLAPPVRALRKHPCCQEFKSDLCQYGAQWKRATKVVTWFCGTEAPSLRCQPTHARSCSRTHRPHQKLGGTSPTGVPWTTLAQQYPSKWAQQWSRVLFDAAMNGIQARLLRCVSCL